MLFLIENVCCDPHLKHLDETVQMRGHNIYFLCRINKNYPTLSPNTPSYLELWFMIFDYTTTHSYIAIVV